MRSAGHSLLACISAGTDREWHARRSARGNANAESLTELARPFSSPYPRTMARISHNHGKAQFPVRLGETRMQKASTTARLDRPRMSIFLMVPFTAISPGPSKMTTSGRGDSTSIHASHSGENATCAETASCGSDAASGRRVRVRGGWSCGRDRRQAGPISGLYPQGSFRRQGKHVRRADEAPGQVRADGGSAWPRGITWRSVGHPWPGAVLCSLGDWPRIVSYPQQDSRL